MAWLKSAYSRVTTGAGALTSESGVTADPGPECDHQFGGRASRPTVNRV